MKDVDNSGEPMISDQAFEEGVSRNKKVLITLIGCAGGEVTGFSRLRIATYMLKDTKLHDYKFEGFCPLGYGDPDFREDLNTLSVYVGYGFHKDMDGEWHRFYKLNELGEYYAEEFASKFQEKYPDGYAKLQNVGRLLNDSEWTDKKLDEKSRKTVNDIKTLADWKL